VSEDDNQPSIATGIGSAVVHTLSLIHQIELRKRYLRYCGVILTAWLLVFLPIGLHYLSTRPNVMNGIVDVDILFKNTLLRSERIAVAAIPTSVDDRAVAYAHHLIDGEQSKWNHFQKDILGLNNTGMLMFYFAGLTMILFISRAFKLYHLS
jgi:hypothetical protein